MQSSIRQAHPGHEKDARWAAVDRYAEDHLISKDTPYYAALQYATKLSEEQRLPSIEVSPLQGKTLALFCMSVKAKHILEVGTLGGYSSIWLAGSSPDAQITTIEISSQHRDVAVQAHKYAGLSDRIEVLLGAGNDVLPQIRKDIEGGEREKFDFVFIDADKPNNLNYLNETIPMCQPRTMIIVDNVVRKGTLADEEAARGGEKIEGM